MTELVFPLPDVGEGLVEATIVRWIVSEGDHVRRLAPLVEIETAKSVTEIPSPITGIVVRHGAEEGAVLEVGATLAVLQSDSDEPAADALPEPILTPTWVAPASPIGVTSVEERPGDPSARRISAAPKTRARAFELGVAIESIAGSGPDGQVLLSDVEEAAKSISSPDAKRPASDTANRGDRIEAMTPMRNAIVNTLTMAWPAVPLITELREIDASAIIEAHSALRQDGEGGVTYTALFCWISVKALARHPTLNVSIDVEARVITYHGSVHLGVAVSVPGGLSVGVVRDADMLTLAVLASEIGSIARAARSGVLSSGQASGATFTVSSFGQFGGWFGTPLVVPPQVAIAGFGVIKDRVVAIEGSPEVRPVLPLSVSVDHRVVDGAELSEFCSTVEALAADPLGNATARN